MQFYIRYVVPGSMLVVSLLAVTGWVLFSGIASDERIHLFLIAGIILILFLLAWMVLQILKDRSEKQHIAGQLEHAREKYNALLETSTNGIILVAGGDIIFANFVFLAMSGYTLNEMKSVKFKDLMTERGKELETLLSGEAEKGKTVNAEAVIRGKRGDLREVVLEVSVIPYQDKTGMIIIVRDISGREKMEKESEDLKNELQSSLLQMNLPLSAIVREHITCDMEFSIQETASLMTRKNQDAVIVMKNHEQPVGIITDTDLRKRVLAGKIDSGEPVFKIMSSPITSIDEQALLYQAILRIREKEISHLVVEDNTGMITGIISHDDLLEVHRNSISYLVREIKSAESVESLKKIHDKTPVLIRILLESGAKIRNITYMISTLTDAITHRLVEFAVEEMGEPPAPFAFMALGSEGRREQTLVTDQDNAIVFEDVPNEKMIEVSRYFLYFGRKINLWLDRIGYRYCQGDVMAGNPQWCQPLSKWKKYFSDWIHTKSEEGLLGVAVFFDFRIVYGMEQYGEELRRHINKSSAGRSVFFHLLAREASGYKVPSELPAVFDIKNTIAPLVDFIRVYAIQNQVTETSSMLRLEKLLRYNVIGESDFHEIANVYNLLMEIRFRSHVLAILDNKFPDNRVSQEELTDMEKTLVSKSFSEIRRYQELVLEEFT